MKSMERRPYARMAPATIRSRRMRDTDRPASPSSSSSSSSPSTSLDIALPPNSLDIGVPAAGARGIRSAVNGEGVNVATSISVASRQGGDVRGGTTWRWRRWETAVDAEDHGVGATAASTASSLSSACSAPDPMCLLSASKLPSSSCSSRANPLPFLVRPYMGELAKGGVAASAADPSSGSAVWVTGGATPEPEIGTMATPRSSGFTAGSGSLENRE
mmetsp:Transcript_7454/g.23498  ORF Transcript_7454/g.23498 Transcript_7454/m.23498 type:complete len:217 (+) Transcript_7454:121-771(+)